MPRKQAPKSAARKKQASNVKKAKPTQTKTSNVAKLETEFFATPARLAAELIKEVAAEKQKAAKYAATVTKIEAQANKVAKTIATAKTPTTAAAKKQLLAAKKALNDTKKDLTLSNTALRTATQEVAKAETRLARAQALAKYLKDFEKTWATQAKKLQAEAKAKAAAAAKAKALAKAKADAKAKAAAAAKAKKKAKKASRPTSTKENSLQPTLTVIEQPLHDTYDTDGDASQTDDAKQVAS